MDIVVCTYGSQYAYFKTFIDTFNLNCLDKDQVTIHIVLPKFDLTFFNKFKNEHIVFHTIIDLMQQHKLPEKSDLLLLDKIKKKSYSSWQKIWGIELATSEYVCMFSPKCVFIRKFYLRQYIDNYKNRYYYSFGNNMANKIQNNIMKCTDTCRYHEVKLGIYNKNITQQLSNIININIIDFDFEYCYFLFCRTLKNYDFTWIEITHTLEHTLEDKFAILKKSISDSYYIKQSSCLLLNNYDNIILVKEIYDILNIPIFEYLTNDIHSCLFLLYNTNIIMGYGTSNQYLNKLLHSNSFNKRIALAITGLIRDTDNLQPLIDFINPLKLDTYVCISTTNKNCKQILNNTIKTNRFMIDNINPNSETDALHKQPNTKVNMVSNTCAMFYKKRRVLELIPTDYDIIIQMRPDLISQDGQHLLHILFNILTKYDNNTIYVPNMYNSFGITDTMAIGSFNIMTLYLKLYDDINSYFKIDFFNPEYIVFKHIEKLNVKINIINWIFKIFWQPSHYLHLWWRYECDSTEDILRLKVASFEIYWHDFYPKQQQLYKITNVVSNANLYITDNEEVTLDSTKWSKFFITHRDDMYIRCNIKCDTKIPNTNNDSTGWNLYTKPVDNAVYGKGNSSSWAQFYLQKEDNKYYFISYHLMMNKLGTFGRYLGQDNNQLVSDLPKCINSQWLISSI